MLVFTWMMSFSYTPAWGQIDAHEPGVSTRTMTVQARVEDFEGNPLVDVPLLAYTRYGIAFGATDEQGTVALELVASVEHDSAVLVGLHDGSWFYRPTEALHQHYHERFEALTGLYAFKKLNRVQLKAGTDQYSCTIVGERAIRLSGVFVDHETEKPIWGVGGTADPFLPGFMTSDTGRFELAVRQGAAAELLYEHPEGHQVHIIELGAERTESDLDLGSIPVRVLSETAAFSLRFQHPERDVVDPVSLETVKSYVVLIEQNTDYMLIYETNRSHTAVVNQPWDVDETPPQAPAGTYYIVAGKYDRDATRALRLALLSGRQAALDGAGVAKVTLVDGESSLIVLDVEANEAAVLRVGGDLVE